MKEDKRFKEALAIVEEFSEDSENVIIFAIECGRYKTAMKLCTKFKHLDLIGMLFLRKPLVLSYKRVFNIKCFFLDKKLLPSLLEEYYSLKNLLETNWNNFIKYRNRLQIVREIKSKKSMEELDTPYANKDSDLYSDAGSTIASSSGSG